ncbi:putative integral membrane protein (TIGR00698 family) [Weissella uvarum]|uniref:YeiH family protein n=1 Tax=Weissella uvarum TaxID=1479233 RepID=UPI00195F2CE4|nr:putative sulfate exporter family transporter [Weissella uvarum]MBM7616709.1 putative integral membrane protein (TIGR00698 family) [Weissella uvarum]MCM0594836.1 putative sulfate exporter family transporter [Weissella uvarum]
MFKITHGMWAGIILTFGVALGAKLLTPVLPALGSETLAMMLGLILGNTVFRDERWHSGIKWSEKYPIEVGIACLGLTLTLGTIASLQWQGLVFIGVLMVVTIAFVMWIGQKFFHVDQQSAMLMASGNAVCGSSAIASVAPAIKANDDQRRTAVATVSLSGTALLLILPLIAPTLMQQHDLWMGALIGGTVQSVGQVVGTAALINQDVVMYATLFKMLRVILLSVVVIYMAHLATKNTPKATDSKQTFGLKIPWFVMAFLVAVIMNTFLPLPHVLGQFSHQAASFLGVVNLAGIGLNLKWSTIKASGIRYLGYGFVTIVFQVLVATSLIYLIW